MGHHQRKRPVPLRAGRTAHRPLHHRQHRAKDRPAARHHPVQGSPAHRHQGTGTVCHAAHNGTAVPPDARTRRRTVHPAGQQREPAVHRPLRQPHPGHRGPRTGGLWKCIPTFLLQPVLRLRQRAQLQLHLLLLPAGRPALDRHQRRRHQPVRPGHEPLYLLSVHRPQVRVLHRRPEQRTAAPVHPQRGALLLRPRHRQDDTAAPAPKPAAGLLHLPARQRYLPVAQHPRDLAHRGAPPLYLPRGAGHLHPSHRGEGKHDCQRNPEDDLYGKDSQLLVRP